MIVFGKVWTYGVQGRKIKELNAFLKEELECTHLEEGERIDGVKTRILGKISFLNAKYPKTVRYCLSDDYDEMRIHPVSSKSKGVFIEVLNVRPFEEGGAV